jgi:hypothetical protein
MQHYQKYNELYQKYTNIYGNKTMIFQLIGSFFEAYCFDIDGRENLIEIANLLQITPSVIKNNNTNILTCKFSIESFDKTINILTENDYTIIIFDTYFDDNNDNQIQIYSGKTLCSMFFAQFLSCTKYLSLFDPFYYCFYLK